MARLEVRLRGSNRPVDIGDAEVPQFHRRFRAGTGLRESGQSAMRRRTRASEDARPRPMALLNRDYAVEQDNSSWAAALRVA